MVPPLHRGSNSSCSDRLDRSVYGAVTRRKVHQACLTAGGCLTMASSVPTCSLIGLQSRRSRIKMKRHSTDLQHSSCGSSLSRYLARSRSVLAINLHPASSSTVDDKLLPLGRPAINKLCIRQTSWSTADLDPASPCPPWPWTQSIPAASAAEPLSPAALVPGIRHGKFCVDVALPPLDTVLSQSPRSLASYSWIMLIILPAARIA